MRGQQSLFSSLFVETVPKTAQKQRPRNYYQPERNEALVHRYYYHAEMNRLRYDDCIRQLEIEFHITAPRIISVLTECTSIIESVINTKPSIKDLENKFPWYSWKVLKRA
jgi:hypothetical protein